MVLASCLASLGATSGQQPAQEQPTEPSATPEHVPPGAEQVAVDAPLLAFYAAGPGGGEHTYVVDALGGGAAVAIGPGRIELLGRFADGRLLCRTGWPEACLVTMAPDGGERRVLVPGGHDSVQPDFLDVQHGRVYVRFARFDERVGSLRVFEPGGPALGTELLDRVEAVLSRSIDGLCVLRGRADADVQPAGHAARGGELWFVPRQPGGARRVLEQPLDFGENGLPPRFEVSPGGRLLAIGCNRLDGTGGHLTVVDVVAGEVTARIDGIRLDVSRLSSDLPQVELAWRDDRVLRYSRTSAADAFEWVDHDVRADAELEATVYGAMELSHQRPRGHRDEARDASARVRVDERGVWFFGGPDRDGGADAGQGPAVPAPAAGFSRGFAGTLRLSPDACAAACQVDGRVLVVDGVHRTVRTVFDGNWLFPQWAPLPADG